uniref:Concentrative nucleoside transporter C-terminal domain-containing protein n=1 Tax=Acrobeloides nanus TaxID=290746 RepID=A0A914DG44_9BILA
MDGPFGFTSLPMIIFFGSICSLLYYYGIIQWILIRLAILLQYTMGTTAGESLNSMASVFLGPTEAAILCQSALRTMTESEVFTMMTAGFSNVMSAPALITVSKLMTPEIQHSKQKDMKTFRFPQCTETSALESISNGAIQTVRIIFSIIANLIVYVAFVTFIDTSIHWLGECVGWDISFDKLMSWAFYPVAYILGVTENHDQTMKLAQLIGLKTVLNEFIAYQKMQDMLLNGELEGRTQMIAIFACCGYSNFSQIGQELGIFIGLCPKRTKSFVSMAVRTLIAGAISCFMTACVAGAIVSDATGCLPAKNIENCLNV